MLNTSHYGRCHNVFSLRFAHCNTFFHRTYIRCHNISQMSWYPHANKLLHYIEKCPSTPCYQMLHNIRKCAISNRAINMHYRRPTKQHFHVLEPHRGCLHKVKKVSWYPLIKKGQWSHKYAFYRANIAIKM